MNRHQNDFGGSSFHSKGKAGMNVILCRQDVSQPLTTAYAVPTEETNEERQRREREVAMAKAAAVTRFYGGDAPQQHHLPVAQPVSTAVVTRAPARRRHTASEPGFLALNKTFRKSSSSLLSAGDLSTSNHSILQIPGGIPSPPPLNTEVTDELLTPPKRAPNEESSYPPVLTADVTDQVSNVPQRMPIRQQGHRRLSDISPLNDDSSHRQVYRERPSFQAFDSYISSTAAAPVLPTKPYSNIYPLVINDGSAATSSCADNNEGGLLRGLAIEEQEHMLKSYAKMKPTPTPVVVDDERTLAVLEQEKLWSQLSNSHRSINTAATAASSVGTWSPARPAEQVLSPQEEQAQLWEQITMQNSASTLSSSPGSSSRRLDPLEEQAQLLGRYQPQRSPAQSAMEEQERMLREFQQQRPICPVEQQAKRLREIQEAKEKQIMEMACKISRTVPHEEELPIQAILDISRLEAEAQARAQQDLERAVLQEALQRSQRDFGGSSLQQHVRQHEQSVDLELRRSIAELACQSSERTLETSSLGRRSLGVASYR